MAASIGRETVLTVDSAAVAGIRTKSINGTKEPIDVTDDDSSGYRELLAESGTQSLEVSVAGITKDRVLREAFHGAEAFSSLAFTYANGDTLTGSFKLTAYNEGNEFNDAQTFEATFMSTGQWTYTAASP